MARAVVIVVLAVICFWPYYYYCFFLNKETAACQDNLGLEGRARAGRPPPGVVVTSATGAATRHLLRQAFASCFACLRIIPPPQPVTACNGWFPTGRNEQNAKRAKLPFHNKYCTTTIAKCGIVWAGSVVLSVHHVLDDAVGIEPH